MFFKKINIFIYILLLSLIINFMIPIYSFAITEDSIYVWSNNSDSISTSTSKNNEVETTTQDNSRKLFRDNFWWCYINGSKNRNCLV